MNLRLVPVKENVEHTRLKDLLVELVDIHRPLKATEIPVYLNVDALKIFTPAIMDELVKEERIVEVEYILPSMPDRIKSVYFPKGTQITVVVD